MPEEDGAVVSGDKSVLGSDVPVPGDIVVGGDPGALIPAPSGCVSPPSATAVFVGRVVAKATNEARFEVEQIKAGSLAGFASGVIVDVRYEESIFYTLEVGSTYLVGAAPGTAGLLTSKVREPKPLFGGDGVIGANDSDVQCPLIEDPIRTLQADGTEIDVGMLTPLARNKAVLVSALARPFAVGFGVLLLLTAIKLLAAATIRALRGGGPYEPQPRQRDRAPRRARGQNRHMAERVVADGSPSSGDGDGAQLGNGVGEAEWISVERAAGDQNVGAG